MEDTGTCLFEGDEDINDDVDDIGDVDIIVFDEDNSVVVVRDDDTVVVVVVVVEVAEVVAFDVEEKTILLHAPSKI